MHFRRRAQDRQWYFRQPAMRSIPISSDREPDRFAPGDARRGREKLMRSYCRTRCTTPITGSSCTVRVCKARKPTVRLHPCRSLQGAGKDDQHPGTAGRASVYQRPVLKRRALLSGFERQLSGTSSASPSPAWRAISRSSSVMKSRMRAALDPRSCAPYRLADRRST